MSILCHTIATLEFSTLFKPEGKTNFSTLVRLINPFTAIINYSYMTSQSCNGFMAGQKAFLPRLDCDRAGIVDLNSSTDYVKPFNQEINATHDERCYHKADRSV